MTNGYKELLEDEPIIPDPTCPHIDKAQQYLEELRDQNEALREAMSYWRDKCCLLLEESCNLNKHIIFLENE